MCDTREFCRSSRDSTMGINFDVLGDVEHFEHISGDLLDLFKSREHADVTFVVNGVRFPAHKVILAARCTYFRILLYGEMKEAYLKPDEEIPFLDTTPEAFELLLEYIYSGRVCLGDLKDDVILQLLGLANKYDFGLLQQAIITYLKATLSVSNVCIIYNVASFYQLKDLAESCSTFVDMHATEVMKSDSFLSLSQTALTELIARDSFFAPEVEIYHGVKSWMEHNVVAKEEAEDLLDGIRLQLIPQSHLLQEIRQSGMFNADKILDALSLITDNSSSELGHRGLLIPEENVSTPHRDACTIEGQVKDALLNGDTENYNGENGYTTHTITRDRSKGITVQLNQPYIVNSVSMLLWDKDNRSYSYVIQVSLDYREWETVVDRSDHLCRSWQELFFPKRVVRYIRVVGVRNTMNRSFHLVSFSCSFTFKHFQLGDSNLQVATENVASISASATVLEGVSRSRNALLNGNTRDYDWDSGYTCHQLGSGCIVIQLAQPYIISSMRLLLWDCDDRSYGYCIDVSCDQRSWKRIVDRSAEACRSWQVLQFAPQPVTFIKIIGTQNSANERSACCRVMCTRGGTAMKDILHKTISVSRELDALQREHQAFITNVATSEPEDFVSASASNPSQPEVLQNERFKASFQEQKLHSLNLSLHSVQKGVEETQLMIMVANYISELEGDKLKLRAQVKRLCAENNWLRESLTESQQLLQEAEVSLGKLKVDKEHLEFLQSQQREGASRASVRSHHSNYMDSDLQAQELTNGKEGIPVNFPMGLPENLPHDLNSLDASLDYETPEKIRMLHQLALQLVNQGKPEVAIPLCRKAVQELEQKAGRNNPDLATLLNILAVIYREQGRFKEAIRVLQETLEIRENVFGPTHAAVASTLNNLSVLHGKCGDFKTAEPFCQRALEIRQSLLGPDHPDVAKQFCNLAVLSSNLGRNEDVEHYYLRALEIFQLELGADDPNVTKTMNNLANCYLKQGKYRAAESMFKKVLKTVHAEGTSAQEHRLHHVSGDGADRASPQPPQLGEPGYWHKITPVQNPTVDDTLRCLTDTYRCQGRLEDAAELERLTKENKFDKAHKDRITQIFGDESFSEKLLADSSNSQISSKTQGLPKNPSSKASLTWKWVVGQQTSQHKYSEESNYSAERQAAKQ